ncbi:hypothetical protein BK133_24470 [Paenibacillus sp. FSL H8-0548]|uniref:DUF948 domain-containing protein n=1 Tax=Paenibacillus sp. FSL H8-0548 TaxID=1920422 RepID=UPI00096C6679|nr:DUF948 domain-containing protein [Paenibacillus sp. FSL H8-0548]OMF23448.1 hypothetical protein BK133_24470 [Paenibacillus sp. FSL H8-0548]
MDILMQISIAVIAVAFLILMYSLIQTLKALRAGLEEMRQTIGTLRIEVTQISVEVKEAVHNTNAMTLDVREKLSSLDGLFASVNDIGHALHSFTGAARESAASVVASIKKESKKPSEEPRIVSTIYKGVISGIRVWNKLKKI